MRVGGRRYNTLLVGLGIALGTLAAGCESGALTKIEQGESLFAAFSGPTPAEAVAASTDPYDADRRLRGMAMIAYAPFGGESVYVRYYVDRVQNDPDAGVRAVAARALGLHGDPNHVPLIVPLLDHPDRNVRHEAVRALQRLHNPVAIDALIAHSKREAFRGVPARAAASSASTGEPDAQVRADACTALGQYAVPRVVQALITAIDDEHLVVNRAALESLRVLTGQTFGDDQRAWLTWFSGEKDPFALRGEYLYPAFSRDKTWIEYIPLVSPPPNEVAAAPAGMGAAPAPFAAPGTPAAGPPPIAPTTGKSGFVAPTPRP